MNHAEKAPALDDRESRSKDAHPAEGDKNKENIDETRRRYLVGLFPGRGLESEHTLKTDAPTGVGESPRNVGGMTRREVLAGGVATGVLAAASALGVRDSWGVEKSQTEEVKDRTPEEYKDREIHERMLKEFEYFERLCEEYKPEQILEELAGIYKKTNTGIGFKAGWDLQGVRELRRLKERYGHDRDGFLGDDLVQSLLSDFSESYNEFWNEDEMRLKINAQEKEFGLTAKYEGFEHLRDQTGVAYSSGRVKELLEKHLDKHWLYENVGTIRFEPQQRHADTFEIGAVAEKRSITNILSSGKEQEIVIYAWSSGMSDDDLVRTISHEVAHHHDWVGSLRLPMHQRLRFLKETTEHFQKSNRPFVEYVDQTIPAEYEHSGASNEETHYRQTLEYWAALNELYDTRKEWLGTSYSDEYRFVEKWRKQLLGTDSRTQVMKNQGAGQ
ncbi:MAG: hypothetical protein KBD21_05640 [Candidatus Pacebacteria bacterium]|nr:hypothetical protein [Candidatus Paceibacterota bacterium]